MKLQTKFLLVFGTGLLAVYLGSCLFQRYTSMREIERFSRECKGGELDRHWQWVGCVQQGFTTSLEKVMATGDMDLFDQILHEQASLPGLQEASLSDYKGRIVYSAVPSRLHGDLPADLKAQLLSHPELLKRQSSNSFEIYKPFAAQKQCVACHIERHEGDIIGVMSLRFSDTALKAAEQSWDDFDEKFSRSNAINVAGTSIVLILLLAGLVVGCIQHYMAVPLKRMAAMLDDGANQVVSAAHEVSSASQTLAEGAGNQASSLEETSASLEELASMTKRNADNSQKVNDLAKQARAAGEQGVGDMETMNTAMGAIQASSDDIAKIIKTIDEIAFQTNILALNAAVEAARAGEAGMGFAVVADEVRNLAQRSAQAAKETAVKIEGAISKTAQGVSLSQKVGESLNIIVAKARQVDELATELAGAAREQTLGISQINASVGQMDKVTQGNAASAEESAAAAQELNAQAQVMKGSVQELLNLVGGGATAHTTAASGDRRSPVRAHATRPAQHAAAQPSQPTGILGKTDTHLRSCANPPAPANGKPSRGTIPMEGDFKDF